jgi:hypothetical protein
VRVPAREFLQLRLAVHEVLGGVPLRDVTAIDLPGGGAGRTVSDVRALFAAAVRDASAPARALFALRTAIGRRLGWDAASHSIESHRTESYLSRVWPELAARSLVAPGTMEAGWRVLFVLEREALTELRNATVHGFLALALVERPGGYRVYVAVYVKPVSRWTPLYMAAIEPFRRFVVYPALARRLERGWRERYRC